MLDSRLARPRVDRQTHEGEEHDHHSAEYDDRPPFEEQAESKNDHAWNREDYHDRGQAEYVMVHQNPHRPLALLNSTVQTCASLSCYRQLYWPALL
jgi:hypothetical protein